MLLVSLTSWNKIKLLHLLHLPRKDKIGALASPRRSLDIILITKVRTMLLWLIPVNALIKGEIEDHVWFEDRWMVASLCDE
jgi:hypothetical protein